MPSWDEFNKTWDTIPEGLAWDNEYHELTADIQSFSGMDVDEDLAYSCFVLFAGTSEFGHKVNQKLGLVSTVDVVADFRTSRTQVMAFAGTFEAVSSFTEENLCSYNLDVVYVAGSFFSSIVGSLYNTEAVFGGRAGFVENSYSVLPEGVVFTTEQSTGESTKYITEVTCTFQGVVSYDIKTHNWGRPPPQTDGTWVQPDAIKGDWFETKYTGKKGWN